MTVGVIAGGLGGMHVIGWILAGTGSLLSAASAVVLIRANPGSKVPIWRRAEHVPAASTRTLILGSGCAIFSAMFMADGQKYWPIVLYTLAVGAMVGVIAAHNWWVRRSRG